MTIRPARRIRRGRSAGPARGVWLASLLVAAAGALAPSFPGAAGAEDPTAGAPEAAALAGTEDYCGGYEHTFHGVWSGGGEGPGARPVLFRIGVDAARDEGCYAQLNLMTPRGVAPYELPRFRVEAGDGKGWTLRYRDLVLKIDPADGTAVLRAGHAPPRSGALLARPPRVGDAPPPAPARHRARWYGKWRGRLSGVPFRVTLRFSDAGGGRVHGRISSLLMNQAFMGRFHDEILIFRWRNRHIGLVMEPGGDALVYNDYKGRTHRFRRRR